MTNHTRPPRSEITIYTMGFTQKTARDFFRKVMDAGVKRVIDIRLNNRSTLAAFTKSPDLEYFLEVIAGIVFLYRPEFAPTKDLLEAYREERIDWLEYERQFNALIAQRHIEKLLQPLEADKSCLLCSEPTPVHCHRRLVAEYLRAQWGNVEIRHLV